MAGRRASIAVQFVVNYEEGGENNILHGDAASEAFLSEIVGAQPWPGQRHMNMESIYEYGSRAGFWRLWRMFTEREHPGHRLRRRDGAASATRRPSRRCSEADWEIASHGLKWIDYQRLLARTTSASTCARRSASTPRSPASARSAGTPGAPRSTRSSLRWRKAASSTPPTSMPTTCPTGSTGRSGPLLAIPYTLDANDMRFATPQGFNSGDQFFAYLKDSFDVLYAEGEAGAPKMMSVGLHCRLVGRPGRAAALARFLDYVQGKERVWLPRRIDIARHWIMQDSRLPPRPEDRPEPWPPPRRD